SAVNVSTGIVWPEINTQQYGIALQQTRAIANDVNLTMGVRSDWTKVSFGRENIAPDMGLMGMMPMTANMLYNQFYGISATDVSEHALSGLLKIEWQTNNNINVYGVVSRSNRTADATERGFANQMIMNGNNSSWIGNPGIASENHNQFEVGMLKIGSNWSFGFSAFLDMVDDFILRDSARGQDGIVMTAPMADVYRNINAKIMGFEMQTQWQISDNVSLHGDIAYSYGQDRDRGEPLAQIPPLQGNIILQTNIADISLTTGMRFAFDQERVDTNPMMGTGRDLSTDTSYAVFDITAHYDLSDAVRLQAGVRNLLDLQYADHLNRSNLLDATEVQVNEPGRSAYAKIVASF
ncbi:MAG: TonB-dependent receptor, partial [Sphingomonadales bacterium]|nr:TonB-dependent receptor [Sphingomonadales bacterium]